MLEDFEAKERTSSELPTLENVSSDEEDKEMLEQKLWLSLFASSNENHEIHFFPKF